MIKKFLYVLMNLYILALLGYGIFGLGIHMPSTSFTELYKTRHMPWHKVEKDPQPTAIESVSELEGPSENPSEVVADFANVG